MFPQIRDGIGEVRYLLLWDNVPLSNFLPSLFEYPRTCPNLFRCQNLWSLLDLWYWWPAAGLYLQNINCIVLIPTFFQIFPSYKFPLKISQLLSFLFNLAKILCSIFIKFLLQSTPFEFTHNKKSRSNKAPALIKSRNAGFCVVGISNQLFKVGSLT